MAITLEVKVSKPVLDFVHLKVYPAPSLLYSGTSDCTREFFSCTTYPGQGWPVRKSFKFGMVRVMPHISQWSLSWQTMVGPWLQISAMHLDSRHSARQRQAGWQIHSLRSPGGEDGHAQGGFQPEASHLSQDIHCSIHVCRGCSSSLPLCSSAPWTSPAPKHN